MLFNAATPDLRMSVIGTAPPLDPGDPGLIRLARLRAVVLLAGSVRANHLRKVTNRRALQMPIAQDQTVFDCWREQLTTMAERLGVSALPVRVMIDQASRVDTVSRSHGPIELTVEPDPLDLRGTGGLLSDIAREYGDDDLLLVGHASQLLFEPLAALTAAIASSSRDVSMICSQDGTPSGLMLIRCGCLRSINPVGYIDLNEQAMPAIACDHDVRVVRYERPVTRSLRTLRGYIHALRRFHCEHHAGGARSARRLGVSLCAHRAGGESPRFGRAARQRRARGRAGRGRCRGGAQRRLCRRGGPVGAGDERQGGGAGALKLALMPHSPRPRLRMGRRPVR